MRSTLDYGIDVGQGINLVPGKFGKKNKHMALAQFISPLIYVFFPIPIMGKSTIEIPISFIPISLTAANGKIFQYVCNVEKYH